MAALRNRSAFRHSRELTGSIVMTSYIFPTILGVMAPLMSTYWLLCH
jgi:hypothetical protein